jgi:CDP-glycerol glycerophosphotransferase (TagB/SpsB family)
VPCAPHFDKCGMKRWLRSQFRLGSCWLLDSFVRTKSKQICFVTRFNAPLAGNLRITLDAMGEHGGLSLGFFIEGPIEPETRDWLERRGIHVMDKYSIASLLFILSSRVVVLSHSARDAYISRRKRGRFIVQLWHGVALKRIEGLMLPRGNRIAFRHRQRLIRRNAQIYDLVASSSETDRQVNAAAFRVPPERVKAGGLPRYDYLSPGFVWPPDLASQREQLKITLRGRHLILYAPTFRDSGTTLDDLISEKHLAAIHELCRHENAVLGIRSHPYRIHEVDSFCDGDLIINLSPDRITEAAIPLEAADILIVDYSSIWVDFLIFRKPIIGYVPDWKKYVTEDRGFIHDLRNVFPGLLMNDWPSVLEHTHKVLSSGLSSSEAEKQTKARELFLPPEEYLGHIAKDWAAIIAKCATLPVTDPSSHARVN